MKPEELIQWINVKTQEDQYTALHYASWKGNVHILKLLIQNGADKYSKNTYGLNCLHVAAQCDQAMALYYFYSLKMNIYTRDKDKLTPLHWACASNAETAQLYLLAWYDEARLNMQDKDGSTALHHTVKQADALGSGRPMRALLKAGIDKKVKDVKGKTAAYYA